MKYLISLLVLCLGAGCATKKEHAPKAPSVVSGNHIPAARMTAIRTPEVVKAYPVGRYSDPNYPNEMHERHTVYRREQSPDWNFLPDPPPIHPSRNSAPSDTKDVFALGNHKHRQFAEALQEQNRALQKRIEQLRQDAEALPGLRKELEQLNEKTGEAPTVQPNTGPVPEATPCRIEEGDVFSAVEPELPEWEEAVTDSRDITMSAESDEQIQDYLLSQIQLNEEFTAELATAERKRFSTALNTPFLRRRDFAHLIP